MVMLTNTTYCNQHYLLVNKKVKAWLRIIWRRKWLTSPRAHRPSSQHGRWKSSSRLWGHPPPSPRGRHRAMCTHDTAGKRCTANGIKSGHVRTKQACPNCKRWTQGGKEEGLSLSKIWKGVSREHFINKHICLPHSCPPRQRLGLSYLRVTLRPCRALHTLGVPHACTLNRTAFSQGQSLCLRTSSF